MKKLFILLLSAFICTAAQALTLEECLALAEANYPLIKKYGLLEQSLSVSLSDVNKQWLPGVQINGQVNVQNNVPSFPDALQGILDQMGHKVEGLGHTQYKVGADIAQTIWDGGESKLKRATAKARNAEAVAALDVQMYALREKVQSLYFAILLAQQQIEQSQSSMGVLADILDKYRSMFANGVVMQSDVDMVEAQYLSINQQVVGAVGSADTYRKLLGIYINRDIKEEKLETPSAEMPAELTSQRPELTLFDKKISLSRLLQKEADVLTMPRFSFFTQAYYGYPGYDYFQSMMNRNLSFNIMAGVKATWTLSSFYHKKNTRLRQDIAIGDTEAERDLFLFNSRLATSGNLEEIRTQQKIIEDDSRIVELRMRVRKAAESQLANGIIDTPTLVAKVNDETQARLMSRYHDIRLLQTIYNLKNLLNR